MIAVKTLFKYVLTVFSFLWFISCQPQEGFIKKINKTAIKTKVIGKDVQLIDVRTPQEYKNGFIDDAVNFNINDDTFIDQIDALDKNEPVYLYCRMGGRSNRAAELMKARGFKKIYDYSGGYDDWSMTE